MLQTVKDWIGYRLRNNGCTCSSFGCMNEGWGPMLTTKVWKQIAKPKEIFLCEPCVRKRLGRPIVGSDLRDCPMNHDHPQYQPHGKR